MADDFRCLEPECSGKTFKSKQSLAGHARWKRHQGDSGNSPVQPESRSSPKLRGESTPAGLGELPSREPPREVRQSRLDLERVRLGEILKRPRAESSLFDGPDKLVAGLTAKVLGPATERVEAGLSMLERIKQLPHPPLPKLPRPPWPF